MTTKCYQLTPGGMTPLDISASTLDEATRALPQGFYTTFATLAGGTKVLGLRDHLRRLYLPAREMELTPAVDEPTLRGHLGALVKENLPNESRVRLIITKDRGEAYAVIQPFTPLPKSVYENGVHVATTDMARHNPRIKDTGFIAESAPQRKQMQGDIFEVLLTRKGKIYEGITSNFYAVPQNSFCEGRDKSCRTLVTARYGILLGVTRKFVLRLARGEGMSIEYRAPRVDEDFDEAFLTSSSRGIVPIVQIDDRAVGQGRVGAWTKRLIGAYQAYVENESESLIDK